MAIELVERPEQREAFVAHLFERAHQMFPQRSIASLATELTAGNVITIEEGAKQLGVSDKEFRGSVAKLRKRLRSSMAHAKRVRHDAAGDYQRPT